MALCKNCKRSVKSVHILVAQCFLGHKPNWYKIIVDHKDNIKTNNSFQNIQLTSVRHNTSKDRFRHNKTSNFVGVNWNTRAKKWVAQIRIEKNKKYLGCFINEIDAHNAYQKALANII